MASLGREINLNPPLTLGQLPDTSEELMKLDQVVIRHQIPNTRHQTPDARHLKPYTSGELIKLAQVFIKSELKVGVIYVKEGQYTEEEILDNNDHR